MKKLKHDHNLTNWLKFGIFALMLLLPFLIFIPNGLYYGFNEHAVAQEKTETIYHKYNTNNVSSVNDLVVGNVYRAYVTNPNDIQNSILISIIDVLDLSINYNYVTNISSSQTTPFIFYGNSFIYAYENVDTSHVNGYQIRSGTSGYVDFIFNEVKSGNDVSFIQACPVEYIYTEEVIVTNMSITDSMSYAWESVWQNDLFSWTTNTGIYTVINNMNTTIGISQESYVANYLTYIFLLTVIYIIVDIIIGTFTMLTHIFNREPK